MIQLKVTLKGGQLEYNKRKLKAVMRAAGGEVAAVTRAMIRSAGGGRTYRGSGGSKYRPYRKGAYQASPPGSAPANVTGTLLRSIVVKPFRSGEGVAIRQTIFYSRFLAKGAKGPGKRIMAPRPSLSLALDQRGPSISTRIAESVTEDIKFVRQKA